MKSILHCFLPAILSLLLGSTARAIETDIVVIGATPGGIAAAISAARSGAAVVLLEESTHVGGVISGGLTMNDIRDKRAVGGLFEEFRRQVLDFYVAKYGADSPQVKDTRGGHYYEPHVVERVFGEMLAGEKNVRVLLRHRLHGVQREGAKLTRVTMDDLASGATAEFGGGVFIDATYEGDLAALAGAAYRVGRESRGEFGERQAGRIYANFGRDEQLPSSTGEGDGGIEAYCFRFCITRDAANRVPFEKPANYVRDDYRHLLADIAAGRVKKMGEAMQMHAIPNGKMHINNEHLRPEWGGVPSESFDLTEENWDWPESGPQRRVEIFRRYWNYTEGMLWLLANDDAVPENLRKEVAAWGFPKDEFTSTRHRPQHLYVHEGRRIVGEAMVTQHDFAADSAVRPGGIAIAEYAMDSHGVHKFDPAHPGVREGYFFLMHPPRPLPYGIIVPQRVDGLLVPMACSASRVAYQTIRMGPVFMALGETAGIAAKMALDAGTEVRAVRVPELQKEILKRGGVIKPPRATALEKSAADAKQPNIIIFLADDLGFNDEMKISYLEYFTPLSTAEVAAQ